MIASDDEGEEEMSSTRSSDLVVEKSVEEAGVTDIPFLPMVCILSMAPSTLRVV